MPSISYNLITKDCPEALKKCLTSVYETLYEPGDECIVVDTGSNATNLMLTRKAVQDFEGAELVQRPDLTTDMRKYAEDWIPEWSHLVGDLTMKSFAAAREVARALSKKDVLFWIDCDDVLIDPTNGGLRKVVNETMDPANPRVNAIFLDYDYAHDADGQCTTVLKRERFVFRDLFEWRGRCHETLVPQSHCPGRPNGYFENLPAKTIHQKANEAEDDLRASDVRNYLIQRKEMEEDGANVDTRTRFYFGNACRGLGRYLEAIKLYKDFNELSGSQDDRWAAAYYTGGMYLTPQLDRPFDSVDAYRLCTEINAFDPRGYFGLARAYAGLQRWKESLFWYTTGAELNAPNGLHSYDPTQVHYHPQLLAARACVEMKDYTKAVEYTKMALGWRQHSVGRELPETDHAVQMLKECQNLLAGQEIAKGVSAISRNIPNPGGPNTHRIGRVICDELAGIPGDLEDVGLSKTEPLDPRPQGIKEVTGETPEGLEASITTRIPNLAIWTGHTGEKWGPDSGKTGIGGSEKMVIMLANAIQALGVNVSVYANMDHKSRGVHPETGVVWRHWAEFDEARPRDALVIWRAVEALTRVQCPAKIRMLWNHDVQDPNRYTAEVRAIVDIIQLQSEFHCRPFKMDDRDIHDKVWIARNALAGVHPDAAKLDFSKKDYKTVCYLSSPDRGLLTAAKIVREAQKTDPDIKFVCCYGVTPWARKEQAKRQHRYVPDVGRDVSVDLYERELHRVLDEVGAVVLGRVGWDKVNEVLQKSGVWLYPTDFDEISCMAAMEAQAHGCVTCSTVHGALQETLEQGGAIQFCNDYLLSPKQNTQEWIEESAAQLLKACRPGRPDRETDRRTMAAHAQRNFAVAPLAKEWISRLGLSLSGGGEASVVSTTKDAECPTTVPAK